MNTDHETMIQRTRATTMIEGRVVRTLVLGAALAVSACGGAQADGAEADEAGEEFVRIINVETLPVAPREFVERVRLTGTVEANRDVTVSAEESGTIVELLVEKGRAVRAGQPIARIDDRLLEPQVRQARAQAELARETWERRKRLWEEDQVGSELAYLEARYAAEEAAARLENLQQRLERTVVEAPVEGILDDRLVEVGTLVGPGTPVARVVDLDPVKIRGGVPERYAADVSTGARATVSFDVLEGEVFDGTVSYVGSTVSRSDRTFPVELTMPNPGGVVKPEMVANISVVRRTLEQAVVVPQDAIVRVEDGYVVFVVEGEGEERVARARPIVLGPSQSNQVVVREGLSAGEELVVVGQNQVADGDRVRVVGSVDDE
jgi:RND family efflux transporter MFP subunit